MAARGIHIAFDSGGTLAGVRAIGLAGSDRFDLDNESLTICGWMRVRGLQGGAPNAKGYCPFSVYQDPGYAAGGSLWLKCATAGAHDPQPWDIQGEVYQGVPSSVSENFTAASGVVSTDQDFFYALVYDQSGPNAGHWVRYYGLDGGGLASTVSTNTYDYTGATPMNRLYIGTHEGYNGEGTNADLTNVKIWKRTFSSAELLAEKTSADPVITTNIWAHYKLLTAAGLTNSSSGVGPTLVADGTVTDGVMDPVDIQGGGGGGSGSPCTFYGRLIA